MWLPVFSFICSLAAVSSSAASMPPDALALLQSFPGRALPLEYVLKRAVESSDQFRTVRASELALESSVWSALAPLDWRVGLSAGVENNRKQPTTPFGTQSQETVTFGLNVYKTFSTGTTLGLEFGQGALNLNFGSLFGTAVSTESSVLLSVSQSLLKNAFGDSTRATLDAAYAARTGLALSVSTQLENLAASTAGAFYQAWSMQGQVRNAIENLARRERLLKIVQARFQRGVAEKPDFLSAKAAVTQAGLALEEQRRILTDQWWQLIQSLKLPEHWKTIDAFDIPLAPWDEYSVVQARCQQKAWLFPSVEIAKQEQAQAESRLVAAQSQMRPDLSLIGKVGGNGVLLNTADAFGTRWVDALTFRHPIVSVGVQLTMPFDRFIERASLAEATANVERADAQLSMKTGDAKIQLESLCLEAAQVHRSVAAQKEIVSQLTERATLEEDRYRRASQSVYNVIQAGDELSQAQFQSRLYEVRLRAVAWNILRHTGIGAAVPGVDLHVNTGAY